MALVNRLSLEGNDVDWRNFLKLVKIDHTFNLQSFMLKHCVVPVKIQ